MRAPDAQHLRTFVTKSNDNFGFKHIREQGFDGVVGMEHGNSRPGAAGEMVVIEAYKTVDGI